MAFKGVLSRIAGSLGKFIIGREKVGNGPSGTAYYRCEGTLTGTQPRHTNMRI